MLDLNKPKQLCLGDGGKYFTARETKGNELVVCGLENPVLTASMVHMLDQQEINEATAIDAHGAPGWTVEQLSRKLAPRHILWVSLQFAGATGQLPRTAAGGVGLAKPRHRSLASLATDRWPSAWGFFGR